MTGPHERRKPNEPLTEEQIRERIEVRSREIASLFASLPEATREALLRGDELDSKAKHALGLAQLHGAVAPCKATSGNAPTVTSGQGVGVKKQLFGRDYQAIVNELRAAFGSLEYGWFQDLNDAFGDVFGMQLKPMTAKEREARDARLTTAAKNEVEAQREFAGKLGLTIWGSVSFKSGQPHSTLALLGTNGEEQPMLIEPANGSFTVGLRLALKAFAGLDLPARTALLLGRGLK